jgi:hypothetical protein
MDRPAPALVVYEDDGQPEEEVGIVEDAPVIRGNGCAGSADDVEEEDDDDFSFLGYVHPTPIQSRHGHASRTELYRCPAVHVAHAFPQIQQGCIGDGHETRTLRGVLHAPLPHAARHGLRAACGRGDSATAARRRLGIVRGGLPASADVAVARQRTLGEIGHVGHVMQPGVGTQAIVLGVARGGHGGFLCSSSDVPVARRRTHGEIGERREGGKLPVLVVRGREGRPAIVLGGKAEGLEPRAAFAGHVARHPVVRLHAEGGQPGR